MREMDLISGFSPRDTLATGCKRFVKRIKKNESRWRKKKRKSSITMPKIRYTRTATVARSFVEISFLFVLFFSSTFFSCSAHHSSLPVFHLVVTFVSFGTWRWSSTQSASPRILRCSQLKWMPRRTQCTGTAAGWLQNSTWNEFNSSSSSTALPSCSRAVFHVFTAHAQTKEVVKREERKIRNRLTEHEMRSLECRRAKQAKLIYFNSFSPKRHLHCQS